MTGKNPEILNQFDIYKQTLERMPVHVYWKSMNFEYLDCNLLQAADLGFSSPSEIIGKTDYDLFPKELADQIRDNDKQVIATQKPGIFDESFFKKSGIRPAYLSYKIPFFDANGHTIGLAGISVDITLRKQREQNALLEKEVAQLTLSNIIEKLPGHVYWKNTDSVYQGCNLAQAHSAGFSNPEQMIGKTDKEMPWRHDADILRESDLAVMRSKKLLPGKRHHSWLTPIMSQYSSLKNLPYSTQQEM